MHFRRIHISTSAIFIHLDAWRTLTDKQYITEVSMSLKSYFPSLEFWSQNIVISEGMWGSFFLVHFFTSLFKFLLISPLKSFSESLISHRYCLCLIFVVVCFVSRDWISYSLGCGGGSPAVWGVTMLYGWKPAIGSSCEKDLVNFMAQGAYIPSCLFIIGKKQHQDKVIIWLLPIDWWYWGSWDNPNLPHQDVIGCCRSLAPSLETDNPVIVTD